MNSARLRPEQEGPLPRPTSASLHVCVLPCQALGTQEAVPAEASSWLCLPSVDSTAGPREGVCEQSLEVWAGRPIYVHREPPKSWDTAGSGREGSQGVSSPHRHRVPVQQPRDPRVVNSNPAFQVVGR